MKRSTLFKDVMCNYSTGDIVNYSSLDVTYLNEKALDAGGVTRDLFSAFWEGAYVDYFDGPSTNQLTPTIFPSVDLASYGLLGSIMVHGYLVSGVLPVRLAFPFLCKCLISPASYFRSCSVLFSGIY